MCEDCNFCRNLTDRDEMVTRWVSDKNFKYDNCDVTESPNHDKLQSQAKFTAVKPESFLSKIEKFKYIDDVSSDYRASDHKRFDDPYQRVDHHDNSFVSKQREEHVREMGPVEGVEDRRSGIWTYL